MDESVFASLTPRERECLRGVRALQGSGQIAHRLGISESAIEKQMAKAMVMLADYAKAW